MREQIILNNIIYSKTYIFILKLTFLFQNLHLNSKNLFLFLFQNFHIHSKTYISIQNLHFIPNLTYLFQNLHFYSKTCILIPKLTPFFIPKLSYLFQNLHFYSTIPSVNQSFLHKIPKKNKSRVLEENK